MIEIKLNFPTIEEAVEALNKISGNDLTYSAAPGLEMPAASLEQPAPEKSARGRKPASSKKEAATNLTKAGFGDVDTPKPVAKKAAAGVTMEQVKSALLDLVDHDPIEAKNETKKLLAPFQAAKISDLDEDQLNSVYTSIMAKTEMKNGADAFDDEDEEDPMA